MIHEVDDVLKGLIGGGALAGSGIDVSFEAPTRDWAARRNAPTVNAYLYDIREDVSRRQRGHMPVRDERDIVVRRRQPPRWFRLSYLVTAWTKQPQDEHRLLSAVLATLLPRELLPADELPGALGALGLSVPLIGGRGCTPSRGPWPRSGPRSAARLQAVPRPRGHRPLPRLPRVRRRSPGHRGRGVRVRGMDGSLEDSDRTRPPAGAVGVRAAHREQRDRPTSAPGTGERQR